MQVKHIYSAYINFFDRSIVWLRQQIVNNILLFLIIFILLGYTQSTICINKSTIYNTKDIGYHYYDDLVSKGLNSQSDTLNRYHNIITI